MNSPLTGTYGWSQVVPGSGYITEFKSNYSVVLKESGAQNAPVTPAGGLPCTVMVRLQVRLFPAASVAVYWTSVSPTGNREPRLWLLVSVRRPPKRAMDIY